MSSSGSVTIGVVAIISGLLGAYGLRALFAPDPPPPPPAPPTLTVPLAAMDLPVGRQIVLDDIALHRMTQKQMAAAGLADTSVMLAPEQIIGRVLQEPVTRGKAFLTTGMYLQGNQPNVTESLQPGYRAVSLEIPAIRGGMTTPGTFVDVLFRSEAQSGPSDPRVRIPEATMTLFEGVEVIGLERPQSYRLGNSGNLDLRFTNGRSAVRTTSPRVTMAVTLQQANVLRTVEGRGEITLAPRGMNEPVAQTSSNTSPGPANQAPIQSPSPAGTAVNAGDPVETQPINAAAAPNDAHLPQASLASPTVQPTAFVQTAPATPIGPQMTLSTALKPLQSMTLESLLGLQAPEEPFMTEIYRRGAREVHVFDRD
ncbi:MAG: Flp pilus assembly protein CpaB [Planctomycetota bacterium]